MGPWESVLLAFGGNLALLAVLGWLARSLLGQLVAKDLERFKSDLTAASSVATERLKHELQLVAQEHQVVVSKLHERRAQVVGEVYGLLVETQWAFQDFVSPIGLVGEPDKKEKFTVAMNKAAEFYRYFDKNRIYLPPAVCTRLDEFFSGMRSKAIGFGIYVRLDESQVTGQTFQMKQQAWIKASEYFDTEVPKARSLLEDELRSIIGAGAHRSAT